MNKTTFYQIIESEITSENEKKTIGLCFEYREDAFIGRDISIPKIKDKEIKVNQYVFKSKDNKIKDKSNIIYPCGAVYYDDKRDLAWVRIDSEKELTLLDGIVYTKAVFNFKDDVKHALEEEAIKLKEMAENHTMRHETFEGDIIITDPCYVCKPDRLDYPKWDEYMAYKNICMYPDYNEDSKTSKQFKIEKEKLDKADKVWHATKLPDDRDIFDDTNLGKLGFSKWILRNTMYGDWSCSAYNSDTKEQIGEFCADGGEVCVLLLDEVLKYNPEFNYHIKKQFTTTLIKDFKGEVFFEKVDEDTLIVRGIGNINFETRQTGL